MKIDHLVITPGECNLSEENIKYFSRKQLNDAYYYAKEKKNYDNIRILQQEWVRRIEIQLSKNIINDRIV